MRYKPIYNPKKKISLFFKLSCVVFLICLIFYAISECSASAADFLNSTVCFWFRRAMAAVSDPIPFSIFEILVISLPLLLVILTLLATRSFKRGRAARFALNFLAVVFVIFSEYTLSLGIAYNTTTVGERMELSEVEVTKDRLADIMLTLRDEINSLSTDITYDENGTSLPEYGFREVSEKICDSYERFSEQYGFPCTYVSHAKPIMLGSAMSYLRLTGIYTFYTGEANVNSAYPMYDMTFTAAHELSHQRGILRENEANFMAYMVTSTSDDAYLRYSAALSMYEYIGNALYRTDKELYYEIASGLSEQAKRDIRASSAVTQKYGDTFLADISNFMNDLFLKSNGTDGVVTYGRVVELTVSYFESKK